MGVLRSISESSSLTDSISSFKALIRTIVATRQLFDEAIFDSAVFDVEPGTGFGTSDIVSHITPTNHRRLFDKGQMFDPAVFDNAIFDIVQKTNEITDAITRSDINRKTITEPAISLSDSVSRLYGSVRTIAESISASDSVTRLGTMFRTISQTVTSSDTVSTIGDTFRSITGVSITLSDSVSRKLGAARSLTESISTSDAVDRFGVILRNITESVSQSDTVDRFSVVSRSITASAISLTDSVLRTYNPLRGITESAISVSDSLTGFKLVLLSLRGTVVIRKILRITNSILKIKRGTVQV
jgi:hypothetical protein